MDIKKKLKDMFSHSLWTIIVFFGEAIVGALIFIGIFGVAIIVSELVYWSSQNYPNSSWVIYAGMLVKGFMLLFDAGLLIYYYYKQAEKAVININAEIKEIQKDIK